MEQLTLFEAKPNRVRPRTIHAGESPASTWHRYNNATIRRPAQCDFCVLNCHEDALAPIPRKARYVRKQDDEALFLCLQHANDQRVIDGLAVYRGT
jgi:hypothetical protein